MPPSQTYRVTNGSNATTNANVGAANRRTPRRNLPPKAGKRKKFLHLGLRELKAQGKRPAHTGVEIPIVALEPLVQGTPFKRGRQPRRKASGNGKRTYPHCPQAKSRRAANAQKQLAKKKKAA